MACGSSPCHDRRRAVRSGTRDRNRRELVGLNLAEPRDSYRGDACQKGAPVPNPSMAGSRGKSYPSTRRQKMSPPYQAEETAPEGGVGGGGAGRRERRCATTRGLPSLDNQTTDK